MKVSQYSALCKAFDELVQNYSMQEALKPDDVRKAIVGHLELNFEIHFQDGILDDLIENPPEFF